MKSYLYQSISPATEALNKALKSTPLHVVSAEKSMISPNALKRSRNFSESFDMSEFEDASKSVEDSIAFPSIEWSFDDNDDEDYKPPSKRICRGLVRSEGSCDLSSLASCQRNGSSGSLCWSLHPCTFFKPGRDIIIRERHSFASCATLYIPKQQFALSYCHERLPALSIDNVDIFQLFNIVMLHILTTISFSLVKLARAAQAFHTFNSYRYFLAFMSYYF